MDMIGHHVVSGVNLSAVLFRQPAGDGRLTGAAAATNPARVSEPSSHGIAMVVAVHNGPNVTVAVCKRVG